MAYFVCLARLVRRNKLWRIPYYLGKMSELTVHDFHLEFVIFLMFIQIMIIRYSMDKKHVLAHTGTYHKYKYKGCSYTVETSTKLVSYIGTRTDWPQFVIAFVNTIKTRYWIIHI